MCAGPMRPKHEAVGKEAQGSGADGSSVLGLAAVTLQSWQFGSISLATVLVCHCSCLVQKNGATQAMNLHHQNHGPQLTDHALKSANGLRRRGCAIVAAQA